MNKCSAFYPVNHLVTLWLILPPLIYYNPFNHVLVIPELIWTIYRLILYTGQFSVTIRTS